MTIHKWLPFILSITSFIIIVEAYVLYHWTAFAKKRNYNKLSYRVPIIISALVVILSLVFNINRLYASDIKLEYNIILIITSFWYLPKILIFPILILKDLTKLFKYIVFSLRNKKNNQDVENNLPSEGKSRREVISTIGWSMALVPFGMAGFGILRETGHIKFHHVNLNLYKFPALLENLKIVQISDIHAGSYISEEQFAKVRQAVNSLNPDIVVITGDFVNFDIKELNFISKELYRISSKYGVYGCMGNHDHYVGKDGIDEFIKRLNDSGVKMLVNENHTIDTGMGKIQIAGVDNSGMSHQDFADFDKALDGLDESNSIIMLCHDPTNWDKSIVGKLPIDLTLAGHTHGGQFGVNIFGKDISPAGFVYKQWAGLYQNKDQYLYVNRGVGMTGPPFRVGVNPEVTLFRLRRAVDIA